MAARLARSFADYSGGGPWTNLSRELGLGPRPSAAMQTARATKEETRRPTYSGISGCTNAQEANCWVRKPDRLSSCAWLHFVLCVWLFVTPENAS
jgi:hypothetical protein